MKDIFLAWQNPDPASHRWFPIGRLSVTPQGYRFVYVKGYEGARAAGLEPLIGFPDLDQVYESPELFPLFANRTMSPHRTDYPEYVQRLGLEPIEHDPIALMSRSEGRRSTDMFELFPMAEPVEGQYRLHFFAHGLRYMPETARERVMSLNPGDRLFLMPDPQNPAHRVALSMRTDDNHLVGYLPRYLAHDVNQLLFQEPRVTVRQVNPPPVTIQHRLLCKIECVWPAGFKALAEEMYAPLAVAPREYA